MAGVSAAAAAAAWWASDSAPYPYAQHWILDLPLPFLTQERLNGLLRPQPGLRVLEIGPGTGLQALEVAPQLGPEGTLEIVDIQQQMLDHVMRRAADRGIGNIVPTLADARHLPYESASFDAAYLVTALGEIPDFPAALQELRRVLKPTGRLVVGEFFDRHQVRPAALAHHANAAGLHVTRQIGTVVGLLRPAGTMCVGRREPSPAGSGRYRGGTAGDGCRPPLIPRRVGPVEDDHDRRRPVALPLAHPCGHRPANQLPAAVPRTDGGTRCIRPWPIRLPCGYSSSRLAPHSSSGVNRSEIELMQYR
ncbi:class I SAM-dependent methyltransferase [Streptomyces sp. NPDC001401]|uniref:class I SAM-dependent methyltransferase n=1 Tax=Streptomyces sp. NPDC001401 TaxID=3364570 RepID=UPI0036A84F7D